MGKPDLSPDHLAAHLTAELHRLAEGYMRGRAAGETLQPTALVNEAWLRMKEREVVAVANREHFLALAATLMRQILVDRAREKAALKRGGGLQRVTLSEWLSEDDDTVNLLALDEALDKLTKLNPERARLVELRYFGGLSCEQAAEVLGVSRSEAARRWRMIKAWLAYELRVEDRV